MPAKTLKDYSLLKNEKLAASGMPTETIKCDTCRETQSPRKSKMLLRVDLKVISGQIREFPEKREKRAGL